MRVLMIHERFTPDSGGGGEYVALRRAQFLIRSGIDLTVLCAGDPTRTEADGVPTTRLPVRRRAMLRTLPQLVAEARKADLVHTFPYHALLPATLAARIARKPLVVEYLALFGTAWRDSHPGFRGRLLEQIEKQLLRLPADARILLSPHSLRLAQMLRPGLQGQVIAPGIDPISSGQTDPEAREILFAGQFSIRKGLDRLADVARRLPEYRFRAIGWYDGQSPVEMPPNVSLVEGRGEAYRQALSEAPLFFLPSRAETFGLVIYEAMMAECSIVSTIPGPYEGAFLDTWSVDAAVEAIRKRVSNPGLARREGQENRTRAARLTWEESTSHVLELYKEILSKHAKKKGDAWRAF